MKNWPAGFKVRPCLKDKIGRICTKFYAHTLSHNVTMTSWSELWYNVLQCKVFDQPLCNKNNDLFRNSVQFFILFYSMYFLFFASKVFIITRVFERLNFDFRIHNSKISSSIHIGLIDLNFGSYFVKMSKAIPKKKKSQLRWSWNLQSEIQSPELLDTRLFIEIWAKWCLDPVSLSRNVS